MPNDVEIGIWVDGTQKWVTGISRKTLCYDVIKALLKAQNLPSDQSDVTNYVIVERWRKVEKPLDHEQRILKVWKTWGEAIQDVKFTLRKARRSDPGSDCETASRAERRKRHKVRSAPIQQRSTHSKKTKENDKVSDTLERLMRLVLAQGETIQTQLKRLQERELQIENYEQEMHLLRVQNHGSDYLLHSYLQPQEARAETKEDSEDKSNDSGVITEETIDIPKIPTVRAKVVESGPDELEEIQDRLSTLEKFESTLNKLVEKEEYFLQLESSLVDSHLSEIYYLKEALESTAKTHAQTVSQARQNEQQLRNLDIILYKKRITLESLNEEEEELEKEMLSLQTQLDRIIHMPPSAFERESRNLSQREDKKCTEIESGSLKRPIVSSERKSLGSTTQTVEVIVENLKDKTELSVTTEKYIPKLNDGVNTQVKSAMYGKSQTNSPSNKSDKKLDEVRQTDIPPPLPSSSPPPLEDKEILVNSPCSSTSSGNSSGTGSMDRVKIKNKVVCSLKDDVDSNSDTGLSSLHSSSDEGTFALDTLV